MQLALAAAATLAHSVVIFSLEMSRDELATRLLYSESRINSVRIRRGLLAASEWGQLLDGAKRVQMEQGLGMIVIDYLQLLHSQKHIDSCQQEVSEVSHDLKDLAKELNVPVIALPKLSIAK
jgi:replicative DNA helicase